MKLGIILSIAIWIIGSALFVKCSEAGAYVDLSVSAHFNNDDVRFCREVKTIWGNVCLITKWSNPLGSVELGYQDGPVSIFFKHTSSISNDNDLGLNEVGIKYRVFGFD